MLISTNVFATVVRVSDAMNRKNWPARNAAARQPRPADGDHRTRHAIPMHDGECGGDEQRHEQATARTRSPRRRESTAGARTTRRSTSRPTRSACTPGPGGGRSGNASSGAGVESKSRPRGRACRPSRTAALNSTVRSTAKGVAADASCAQRTRGTRENGRAGSIPHGATSAFSTSASAPAAIQ